MTCNLVAKTSEYMLLACGVLFHYFYWCEFGQIILVLLFLILTSINGEDTGKNRILKTK